jgi:hypothetical protein
VKEFDSLTIKNEDTASNVKMDANTVIVKEIREDE